MSTTWVSVNLQLGYPAPGTVDAGISRGGTTYPSVPIGTIAQFRDVGTTQLGTGEFVFLPGVASTVAGDVVSYIESDGAGTAPNNGAATTRWAGTAGNGFPLAVATAATVASSWGWYQIAGAAIVNTSGTVAAGDPMYWQATATLSHTAVNGKQVLGAQAGSANGVPATNQAIVTINRPHAQSQAV